jgi:AcrR family transcriptional regulator
VVRVGYQEGRGRARQRARTRRQILEAAVRLMHEGTIPTVEQAAAAADVSPATGYRYFPTRGALLREAVDAAFPTELVHELKGDSLARVDHVIDRGFPELVRHEVFDRAVLRLALDQWLRRRAGQDLRERPVERPGRKPLVHSILEPLRGRASARELRRLELALAMIMGIESYVALSDIYGVKPREAKEVWRWACKALIRAVESEADGGSRSGSP